MIGSGNSCGSRWCWSTVLGAACSLLADHPARAAEPTESRPGFIKPNVAQPAVIQPTVAQPAVIRPEPVEPVVSRETAAPVPRAASATGALPRDAYQTAPAVVIPYSKLFRDTGAPYNDPFHPLGISPSIHADSVQARATVALPIHASFPLLQRGFEPQDADLKLGPLFFKLREISGAVLWSDNINLEEDDPESGTIAITTIGGSVIAQLTEGLRLALSGSFVYLPLQNEAGIAGFGLQAPYILGLGNQPLLHSQVTWDTQIRGWNVLFADNFRIGVGRFSNNLRDNAVLFPGGDFDGRDTAGRYTFGAINPLRQQSSRGSGRRPATRNDGDIVFFSNIVSAQTDRLIVGKTRLTVRGSHENLWYNQGNRGLPTLRDQIIVRLASERENLRFKPFATYAAQWTDTQIGFNQTLLAGIAGPITDQLQFHGEAGYFFGNNVGRFLWGLRLQHQAGPYTDQSLFYRRAVNDFNDEISEFYGYNIHQILGPKVIADGFISRANVEALRRDGFSRTENRAGVRIRILAGPRTNITLSGIGADVSSNQIDFRLWTGRVDISHFFTDTLLARLSYQYQQRDSDFPGDSYEENLIYFGLSKYFN